MTTQRRADGPTPEPPPDRHGPCGGYRCRQRCRKFRFKAVVGGWPTCKCGHTQLSHERDK